LVPIFSTGLFQEEIKKKGPNYNVIFAIPLFIICFSLLSYVFVEIYRLYNSESDVFQRIQLKDVDIKNAENFLKEVFLKVKKHEKISGYLANIPETWKKRIEEELCKEKQRWKISSISQDKFKIGNVPLLICEVINENNNIVLRLFLLKESEKFLIFKVEKIKMEDKHEEK